MVEPVVYGGGGKRRKGKGFSIGEIKKANLDPRKVKIKVDKRRKSIHEENVKRLLELRDKMDG
jgi:ribosomal protein L13E